jgi:hypothetical protein
MAILDTLQAQLGEDSIRRISQQVGADPEKTATAVSGALPLLVSALARNTQQGEGGAQSLLGALDRDHDGSILNDVLGFLGQGDTSPGEGILRHVLGSRRPGAEQALGKMSGLDAGKIAQILALLAPLVMGALGRERKKRDLGTGGLADLLGQEKKRAEEVEPEGMGILGKLLDSDRDGQVGDDLTRIGMGLLNNFLGGRR